MPEYVIHKSYDDFDALAADARAWDVRFVPRDRGTFLARLSLVAHGPVQLGYARFGRSLIQSGQSPAGHRTFVVPARACTPFRWRGREVGPGQLLLFPRHGELHAGSTPGFEIYTIAIHEEHLAHVAAAHDLPTPDGSTDQVFRCRPSDLDRLWTVLPMLAARAPDQRSRHHIGGRLVDDLPRDLLRAAASRTTSEVDSDGTRLQHARRMRALLENHRYATLSSVHRLSALLGVSERTLRRVCTEAYGCGPKELLATHRLHGVRRVLLAAPSPTTRIADIAAGFGFWHMGQFAADYRKRYGELPSETMSIARDSRPAG